MFAGVLATPLVSVFTNTNEVQHFDCKLLKLFCFDKSVTWISSISVFWALQIKDTFPKYLELPNLTI